MAEAVASSRSQARANLLRIYAAAVSAADPRRVMARALTGEADGAAQVPEAIAEAAGIRLIAVGKAARGMADEAVARLGERIAGGLVIEPRATVADDDAASVAIGYPAGVKILSGAHPLPDASSENGARAALEVAAAMEPGELLIVALSGGASAMMAAPAAGITLADKIAVTAALMRAGAGIHELNIVRKHLSAIKGGGLIRAVRAEVPVIAVILSDVPGNDLGTIGSGPLAADPSTFSDAIGVMKRRRVWGKVPEAARDRLERGAAGEMAETVKPNDPMLERVTNLIAGDNRMVVEAAAHTAASLGYRVERWRDLEGEADAAGRALAEYLAALPRDAPIAVIAGGETTVTVKGSGRGGRSQQAALAAAIELARMASDRRLMLMFAGTDGIDGPTDAAGAIVTAGTVARAGEAGFDAASILANNDCYRLFKGLGDLVITGATGTNVADIMVALVNF
jgi:hydroxypyruvate reductase